MKNKTILITGGTGSFGQTLAQKILKEYEVKKVIIFSRDEMKQYEMKKKFVALKIDKKVRFFIGDIRDFDRVKLALSEVDIVVHAAALKIVDTAEYNPIEFVKTNIYGAENIIKASLEMKVKKVIALSTDKAVNPINLYGATKLAADKLFVAANNLSGKFKTTFSVVRYGNVVGSRGSIIPFFKELDKTGAKFFPITDTKMTRFWISLDQGVAFVLKNLTKMRGGEVFIPKMPSFRIPDLASAINRSKHQKIIGIRPGEKIHEIMCSNDEAYTTYEFKDYYIIFPSIVLDNLNSKLNKRKIIKGGKLVNKDFEYSSFNNKKFLTVKEIEKRTK